MYVNPDNQTNKYNSLWEIFMVLYANVMISLQRTHIITVAQHGKNYIN